ncbi:MAG: thiamine diphosphokinase [Bacteroidetes bacterium]|nr:MAG: thiamine diphosphokinase [Bacteroidota bacterium]
MNPKNALVIANGESCSTELLLELKKKAFLLVVLDSAIHRVLELGINPDVLLGDFDRNIDRQKLQELQPKMQIIHTPNQDKTDLEKAFEYLSAQNFTEINVIWATGRRADHTITNITNIVQFRKLKITIIDDYSNIFLLPYYFEKYYVSKTPISLIPVGKVCGIKTQNLKYPLDNEYLTIGYKTGSSNEVSEDGMVKINYQTGDLLMMECKDR